MFNNFDGEFKNVKRAIYIYWCVGTVIGCAVLGFVGYIVVAVLRNLGIL